MALLLRCWNRVLHGLSVGNVLLRLGSNEETNFTEFFSFFFVSLALYGDRSPGFVFTEFFLVLRYRIERCFMPSGVNSNRIVSSRFSGHLATFDLIFVAAFTGFYWVVLSLYGASRVFVFFCWSLGRLSHWPSPATNGGGSFLIGGRWDGRAAFAQSAPPHWRRSKSRPPVAHWKGSSIRKNKNKKEKLTLKCLELEQASNSVRSKPSKTR